MARLVNDIFLELDKNTLTKLHARNILTVYDFMQLTCDEVSKKTDLSFKEIENLRAKILSNFGGRPDNSVELYQRGLCDVIPTGVESLDILLEGGLFCGKMYELCGHSSAGKSQLCNWISIQATVNASTEVHYMDTSSNFCISRIQMILETRESTNRVVAKVMSNIKVYKITKVSDAFSVLYGLANAPKDQAEKCKKLVIIDSLTALLATISHNDLNPLLSNLSSVCRYFANRCRGTVVTVNTVREGSRTLIGTDKDIVTSKKPALTNYWLSVPNVRLLMGDLGKACKKIEVWKSCQLVNGRSCAMGIGEEGIYSVQRMLLRVFSYPYGLTIQPQVDAGVFVHGAYMTMILYKVYVTTGSYEKNERKHKVAQMNH